MPSLGELAGRAFKASGQRMDVKKVAQKFPKDGKLTAAAYILPKGTRSADSLPIPPNYVVHSKGGIDYAIRRDLVNPKRVRETGYDAQ